MAKYGNISNETITLEGIKEVNNLLRELPLKLHANALRSVHRAGANHVVKPEIASGGVNKKIVSVKPERGDPTGILINISSKVFWYRFIEYGTTRRTTSKGQDRGVMSEEPFFRPAVNRAINPVIKYMSDNYGELINKFLSRKVKAINKAKK